MGVDFTNFKSSKHIRWNGIIKIWIKEIDFVLSINITNYFFDKSLFNIFLILESAFGLNILKSTTLQSWKEIFEFTKIVLGYISERVFH